MTMERQRSLSSCMAVEGQPYKRDTPKQKRKMGHIQLMRTAYSLPNRLQLQVTCLTLLLCYMRSVGENQDAVTAAKKILMLNLHVTGKHRYNHPTKFHQA